MNGYYLTDSSNKRRAALRKILSVRNQRNVMGQLMAYSQFHKSARDDVKWLNQFMVPNNFFEPKNQKNVLNLVSPNVLANLFKKVAIKPKKIGVRK
jgi:hypothetical protein